MTGLRRFASDERAVSATVTHALALGISAILISGLLVAGGTLLEDQRENSANEQLRTVGNRIADDLARAAILAQDGGDVEIRSKHPTRIAGQTYTVALLTGADCDTELFTTDACLELELQDGGTRTMVPVRNETAVQLTQRSTGAFTVAASENESAPIQPIPTYRQDLRVGIGDDIDEFAAGTAVNVTNRDPIAGFTFTPGQPSVNSTIRFQNDTEDLDGFIVEYAWDFDDDGTADRYGREVDHNFARPGKYTVTLTVTDDDGESDSVSKVVSVGGLVYERDAEAKNVSVGMVDGAIHFDVTNNHTAPIEINEVLIDPLSDPAEGGPDELDSETVGDPYEVHVDGDFQAGTYDGREAFLTDGMIFDIGGNDANLSAGDTAAVEFNGFQASGSRIDMDPGLPSNEPVFVAMRYEVDGQYYTAQFTLFGSGGGGGEPPEPEFTWDCSAAPACTFDGSATDPDGGSIVSYKWGFADGETATVEDPSHEYPVNGTYDVGFTVVDDDGTSSTIVKEVKVGTPRPVLLFAVNAAGPEQTVDGVTYEADLQGDPHRFHTGDDRDYSSPGEDIANTSSEAEEILYRTVRYGNAGNECTFFEELFLGCTEYPPGSFGYDVPVPDGQYVVTFKFAEISPTVTDGDREIEVTLEGSGVLSQYDVYDRVGEDDHALDVSRTVTVADGELNIDFEPDSNERAPMVNAITVEQVWAKAFQEDAGVVSMEAENYMRVVPGIDDGAYDMNDDSWSEVSDGAASGGSALVAGSNPPHDDAQESENGERLDYYVDLDSADSYDVWVRMKCSGVQSNALDVGLDGEPVTHGGAGTGLDSNSSDTCGTDETDWMWVSEVGNDQVTIDPDTSGKHTLNVWLREDGVEIDKVVLTKNDPADEVPGSSGPTGPPESTVS